MNPRQPIATVAYAINAETLQGLPPSASGLKNTVLTIGASGNINLGETSPSIISTSGTFGIEGQAVLIKASDTSGGNIEINPDANGIIKLTTEGSGSTDGIGLINATNASLSTGNLINASINNTSRGYNFLNFQNYNPTTTTLATRFSVDASGNTLVGGTLSATNISIGNTLLTTSAYRLNLFDTIAPTAGSLIYGNGSKLVNTSVGTSGQVLMSNGSGTPTWINSTSVGNTYTAGNGLSLVGNQFKLGGLFSANTDIGFSGFNLTFSDAGSTFASFSSAGNTFYNPTTFMSAGDVSMSYDLNFTNSTSSTIRSNSPLYIQTESPYANLDITLTAANSGKIYLNSDTEITKNLTVGGTFVSVGSTNLVTNLNVDLLDGLHSSSFLQVGTSGSFISNLTAGTDISITGTGIGRTINDTSTLSSVTARGSSTSTTLNLLGGAYFGSTNQSILKANGTVGIGTTNPLDTLDVKTAGQGSIRFGGSDGRSLSAFNAAGAYAVFNFQGGANFNGNLIGTVFTDTNTNKQSIKINSTTTSLWTNSLERLTVLNDGNVGIGTTNPSYKLDVSGTGRFTSNLNVGGTLTLPQGANNGYILTSDSSGNAAWISPSSTGIGTSYAAGNGLTLSSNNFKLGGALTENTRLNIGNTEVFYAQYSTGNIGIGTTTPGYKLDVVGSGRFSSDVRVGTEMLIQNSTISMYNGSSSIYAPSGVRFTYWNGSNVIDSLKINNVGNVGIGTTNPSKKLDVIGNGSFSTNLSVGGTLTLPQGAGANKILQSDASGNASWVTAAGIGGTDTLSAGQGISITSVGVGRTVALNLASANTWTGLQTFNATGAPFAVGSSTLVTNLNADLLDGHDTSYFINIGQTAPFIYTAGNGLSLSSQQFKLGGLLSQNTDIGFSGFSLTFSDAGTTFASFSSAGNTFYNPTTFMSSGDVSMAYDLNFTNSSGANINSSGPLSINSGETFGSSNLTLQTYNSGKIILNSSNLYNDGTYFGIGTTTPSKKLDVIGNGSFSTNLSVGGTLTLSQGAASGYLLTSDSSGNATWTAASGIGGTNALSAGTDISITSAGVGRTISNTSTLSSVTARGASTSTILNLLGGAYFGSTNQSILKNDGKIGIGTTNPQANLQVGSGQTADLAPGTSGGLFVTNTGGANNAYVFQTKTGGGNFLITNAGNVGIGTTSPSQALDVNGKIAINGQQTIYNAGAIDDANFHGSLFIGNGGNSSSHTSGYEGYFNTGVGIGSLVSNTTGRYNTAIGSNSLNVNNTGWANTAIGYVSLGANTSGYRNMALGESSLNKNTVGNNNTALGYAALHENISGSNGVAIGAESQYYANDTTTAWTNYNTSIGYQALRGSTTPSTNTGNSNTATGYQSLLNNTTGYQNSAQGAYSLYSNTSGYFNSAQGTYSLFSNTIGYNNTAQGFAALYNLTGAYNNNTALGTNSGRYYNGTTGNLTAIDNSLFLGTSASALADSGTNEIVIGYNAIGNGSNSATLGNDSITKTILKGSVGIGTTSPNYKLEIKNSGTSLYALHIISSDGESLGGFFEDSSTNGMFIVKDSASTSKITLRTSGDSFFNGGNVGIGTTSPIAKLHVEGQCVTGDTLLKRKKKKKHSDDENEEDEWEDVPIKDIQVGDEILTLDEKTGKFVNQKIEALMDMGIQQVYKLVTQSGKTIETTDNHPYFVQPRISVGTFEVDQSNRIEQLTQNSFVAIANEDNQTVVKISTKTKQAIYANFKSRFVKSLFAPELFARSLVVALNQMPVIPAQLIIDQEYPGFDDLISRIIRTSYPEINFKFQSIGKKSFAHLAAYELGNKKHHKKMTAEPFEGTIALLHTEFTAIRNARDQFKSIYQNLDAMSRSKWVKTKFLKPGMLIATVDGWETIKKVYPTTYKQTYDIQVANTHNFVGNNIVAHNTFINGGIGVTGSATISNNLNVGVGITTPKITLTNGANNGYILTSDASGNATWTAATGIGGTDVLSAGTDISITSAGVGRTISNTSTLSSVTSRGASTSTILSLQGGAYFGSTNQSILNSSGYIGIGKTNPTQALDVNGKIAINGTQTIYNAQAYGGFTGSLFYGSGGNSLSHTTGEEGYYNTGVGIGTLYSNITGSYNSAQGYSALYSNTTGSFNTAQGMYALQNNTTGNYNSAQGSSALYSNKTGSSGLAIGYESQRYANDTTTAWTNYNTSIGYQALRGSTTAANNTGNNNTAIGYQTLLNNTSGGYNSAIGYQALLNNTAGGSNTSQGFSALSNLTGSYDFNTALGTGAGRFYGSGTDGLTQASQSVFIGANSRALANSGTNEIVIGYNVIGNGSNSATLGNDSITKTILKGNVGIGTTNPLFNLQIKGTAGNESGTSTPNGIFGLSANNSNTLLTAGIVDSSYAWMQARHVATATFYPIIFNPNGGNVGIGTTNPTSKLSVIGNGSFSTNLSVGGTLTLPQGAASGYLLTSDSSGNASWTVASGIGGTDTLSAGTDISITSAGVGRTISNTSTLSSVTGRGASTSTM